MIFDIRNNGGGLLSNSERIASRFADQKTLTGYIQHKTGTGHDDFSEPYPVYVEPSERVRWLRPVVVLTNRQCYSAANDFVQRMREMPYAVIMGAFQLGIAQRLVDPFLGVAPARQEL